MTVSDVVAATKVYPFAEKKTGKLSFLQLSSVKVK
jgi:hypothetical protein